MHKWGPFTLIGSDKIKRRTGQLLSSPYGKVTKQKKLVKKKKIQKRFCLKIAIHRVLDTDNMGYSSKMTQ